MISDYPEQKPNDVGPMKTFKFSLDSAAWAQKDLTLQLEAFELRLEHIVNKCALPYQGHPITVLDKILDLTHDPVDLRRLAKGLEKIASFIENLDDLREKSKVLDMITKDPQWITWAFGDFEQYVESGLQSLQAEE